MANKRPGWQGEMIAKMTIPTSGFNVEAEAESVWQLGKDFNTLQASTWVHGAAMVIEKETNRNVCSSKLSPKPLDQ